jgi:signal transduction histidine kinase
MNDNKKSNLIENNVFQKAQERKLKEQAFKFAAFNKNKKFFDEALGGAHHEINNLLQQVNIMALEIADLCEDVESINKEDIDKKKEQLEQSVEDLQEKTSAVDHVLQELRSIFSEDDEKAPVVLSRFSDLYNEADNFCKRRIENHNITYETSIEDFEFEAQTQSFKRAFVLLLTNAHQAIHEQQSSDRKIFVETEDLGDSVNISISDTAELIDEEDVQNIFTPFYNSIDGRNTMALAIAKNIIERHGGNIYLDVTGGKNSFVVNLPKLISHENRNSQKMA